MIRIMKHLRKCIAKPSVPNARMPLMSQYNPTSDDVKLKRSF